MNTGILHLTPTWQPVHHQGIPCASAQEMCFPVSSMALQKLEKGWVGNGTGRPVGESDTEEDCTPRTDLKKMSPAQR